SVSTAAGSAQVGRGVTLSAIDGLFAQGSFESSSTATDMAIGGQGFFMLRAPDSTEASMYSRAGEFRFDQEGFLTTPVGDFVQGWHVSTETGEREGTIGDISLGKNTPPVATETIDVIANLDSREINEVNEDRLFSNWNGTNAAAVNPTDPIDSTKYDYTTAIKIYDSKGASHDISIFYDRTTNDNEWEYLITCDPTEDLRTLTTAEQVIYNPDTRYNYENHKGAGALLYGTIKFDTSGNLTQINAFKVPPDGFVDPAKNDNRILLEAGDSYYTFPSNFTGDTTNQEVEVNFGGRYEGQSTTQRQILVSDEGARILSGGGSVSTFVTSATTWADVADSNGNTIVQGDMFIFQGYDNNSDVTATLVYTVDETKDVQDLLTQLEQTFDVTATIDSSGHLKLSDNSSGDSSLYVTRFETISGNNATPWGGDTPVVNTYSRTNEGITSNGTTVETDPTAVLVGLQGTAAGDLAVGDTFEFSGTSVDGTVFAAAPATTFTVAGGDTIDDLLTFIESVYEDPAAVAGTTVQAVLDSTGRIRVIDLTQSGDLAVDVTPTFTDVATIATGNPWGLTHTVTDSLTQLDSVEGQINITTSKKMVYSTGRALSTGTGDTTPIAATTQWDSVYDDNISTINGGLPRAVNDADQITFTGTKSDNTSASFTYEIKLGESPPVTVQDLLDQVETEFDCEASIDNAGRLVLTDRTADTVSFQSALGISSVSISYGYTAADVAAVILAGGTEADLQHDIFGAWDPATITAGVIPGTASRGAFEHTNADISSEDGSQSGDVVTVDFEPEALSSTQYANSSTTVFQDQNGFSSGFLQSVSVDVEGVITGHYSNGQVLKKAQVALANFSSLAGLRKEGGNIFSETTESGAPVTGAPGTNGLGSIAPNALEQSNVDLGSEFVKLITVQRGFQANSKIITTTDDMLNDLINIKR
ncbi:MAG TPA: flagellar hook-basal body complex protein, partial [Balneolales bacterium]|nr:flagellar hook-basal body complex protein [Balneolales bacterium]